MAEGLHTSDNLRCLLTRPGDAEAAGGTFLKLAWEKAVASGPTDKCLLAPSARTDARVSFQTLGRLLARPPLLVGHRPGKPRFQPKKIDPDSDLAARRTSATAVSQLSFSWHPHHGLAASTATLPVPLLEKWREQCIQDISIYEPAVIDHGLRT